MADTRKKSTAKKSTAKRSSAKKSTAAKAKASAAGGSKGSRSKSSGTHEPVCTVTFCPICQAAKAGQGAGPEALGHLMAAAREFFLAAKVVVEAMPKDPAGWRPGGASGSNGGSEDAGTGKRKGKLEKISVS